MDYRAKIQKELNGLPPIRAATATADETNKTATTMHNTERQLFC